MADFRHFLEVDGSPSWGDTTAEFCEKSLANLPGRATRSCGVPRRLSNLFLPRLARSQTAPDGIRHTKEGTENGQSNCNRIR